MNYDQEKQPDDDPNRIVVWLAWKSDGRGFVFRAPQGLSKANACELAEEIYGDLFVTVQQL